MSNEASETHARESKGWCLTKAIVVSEVTVD